VEIKTLWSVIIPGDYGVAKMFPTRDLTRPNLIIESDYIGGRFTGGSRAAEAGKAFQSVVDVTKLVISVRS